jgi:hypothetical protein
MKRTRLKTDLDYNLNELYILVKIQCKNIHRSFSRYFYRRYFYEGYFYERYFINLMIKKKKNLYPYKIKPPTSENLTHHSSFFLILFFFFLPSSSVLLLARPTERERVTSRD